MIPAPVLTDSIRVAMENDDIVQSNRLDQGESKSFHPHLCWSGAFSLPRPRWPGNGLALERDLRTDTVPDTVPDTAPFLARMDTRWEEKDELCLISVTEPAPALAPVLAPFPLPVS